MSASKRDRCAHVSRGAHTYPEAGHANHSLSAEAPTAAAARALMKALAHATSSQCERLMSKSARREGSGRKHFSKPRILVNAYVRQGGRTGLVRTPGCGVGEEADQDTQT